MQIALFILMCLYIAWTGLIIICYGSHMISKYILGQHLPPISWNWLPKTLWIICTVIVVLYYLK